MKLTEVHENNKASLQDASASHDSENIISKLIGEQQRNEEIKKQLLLEKDRADRLQKKVQFIEDNQDLFNQLKETYANIKESKENTQGNREILETGSQTNAAECLRNSLNGITTVNRKDLLEVTKLVQDLKTAVTKGGKRVFTALETDKLRDIEQRKIIESENEQLKRELCHKSSELERLRLSSGSGPREVSLLRRIVAKLSISNDLSNLSERESQLARTITKKYEQRHSQADKKLKEITEQDEEVLISVTPYVTARDYTEKTPRTPNTAKQDYITHP